MSFHVSINQNIVSIIFLRCGYFSTERQTMLAVHDEVAELPEGKYVRFLHFLCKIFNLLSLHITQY